MQCEDLCRHPLTHGLRLPLSRGRGFGGEVLLGREAAQVLGQPFRDRQHRGAVPLGECGRLDTRRSQVPIDLTERRACLVQAGARKHGGVADVAGERGEVRPCEAHAAGDEARAQRQRLDFLGNRLQRGDAMAGGGGNLAQLGECGRVGPVGVGECRDMPAGCRQVPARSGQRLAGELGDIVGEPPGQPVQDADRGFQALPSGEKSLLGQGRRRSEPARGQ